MDPANSIVKKTIQAFRKTPVEAPKAPTSGELNVTLEVPRESVTFSSPGDASLILTGGQPQTEPEATVTFQKAEAGAPPTADTSFAHPTMDSTVQLGANGTLLQFEEPQLGRSPTYVASEPIPGLGDKTFKYLGSGAAKEQSHVVLLAADTKTAATSLTASLAVDANNAASTLSTTMTAGTWMTAAASAGGGLLVAHGLTKAVVGSGPVERLAGVSEANWGGQTLLTSAVETASGVAATAAKALGLIGGSIQVGLGVKKMGEGMALLEDRDGVKAKSKEKIGIGAAETLAGTSWILASLGVATGVTLPAFVCLTVGAKCYQHRDKIKGLAQKGLAQLQNATTRAQSALEQPAARPLPKYMI